MEKYNCLLCKNEISNDSEYEQNVEGMVFRSTGNWFGAFDCAIMFGFDNDTGIEIAICQKCLFSNVDDLKLSRLTIKTEKEFMPTTKLHEIVENMKDE